MINYSSSHSRCLPAEGISKAPFVIYPRLHNDTFFFSFIVRRTNTILSEEEPPEKRFPVEFLYYSQKSWLVFFGPTHAHSCISVPSPACFLGQHPPLPCRLLWAALPKGLFGKRCSLERGLTPLTWYSSRTPFYLPQENMLPCSSFITCSLE